MRVLPLDSDLNDLLTSIIEGLFTSQMVGIGINHKSLKGILLKDPFGLLESYGLVVFPHEI